MPHLHLKEPLLFSKENDSSSVPTVYELSHWHVPSSTGQAPVLNLFPQPSGISAYTISAYVDVAVGELQKMLIRGTLRPYTTAGWELSSFLVGLDCLGKCCGFQFWEIYSVALGWILWFEKNKYFVLIPTCHLISWLCTKHTKTADILLEGRVLLNRWQCNCCP